MEADCDHATTRESFSLVQNILFIEYADAFPAHLQENMVEKLWKAMQFVFLIMYSEGNFCCPCDAGLCAIVRKRNTHILSFNSSERGHKHKISPLHYYLIKHCYMSALSFQFDKNKQICFLPKWQAGYDEDDFIIHNQ